MKRCGWRKAPSVLCSDCCLVGQGGTARRVVLVSQNSQAHAVGCRAGGQGKESSKRESFTRRLFKREGGRHTARPQRRQEKLLRDTEETVQFAGNQKVINWLHCKQA